MIRKGVAIVLILMILFFMGLSILAIWEVINVEHVIKKTLWSLMVIFVASAVILFVFAILYKGDEPPAPNRVRSAPPPSDNA